MIIAGRTLVAGTAQGVVKAIAPLSFWGGYDATAGVINDRSHADHGLRLKGCIVVMTCGRGSSSSSSVVAEAIRLGTAPAAFVLSEPDPILAVGAMVAFKLYGQSCPVVVIEAASLDILGHAADAVINAEAGTATVSLDRKSVV